MATQNMFELLGDEETDASAVIERAAAMEKVKKQQQQQQLQVLQHQDAAPKLPSKPLPPAEAVREAKASPHDDGRARRGRGRGRGGYGNRDREFNAGSNFSSQGVSQSNQGLDGNEGFKRNDDGFQGGRGRFYNQGRAAWLHEEGERGGQNFEGGRGRGRGQNPGRGRGRRQGRAIGEHADFYTDGTAGQEQLHRAYVKKDVAGEVQGTDDVVQREGGDEVAVKEEKDIVVDQPCVEATKGASETGEDKKVANEEEDNEMLLDDYYKAMEEKTKHLKSKTEERKVVADKEFDKMVMVARKLDEGDFVKLGSDKDKGKKKEATTLKDDKLKKNMSINEFLKPASGEVPASGGGRWGGRDGRGGGGRRRGPDERVGGFRGGGGGGTIRQSSAPRIEDPGQFPSLGTK